MTDDLRHWIGALFIAAALALVGLVLPTDQGDGVSTARGGLLGLAALVGVIALLKIGASFMRSEPT